MIGPYGLTPSCSSEALRVSVGASVREKMRVVERGHFRG